MGFFFVNVSDYFGLLVGNNTLAVSTSRWYQTGVLTRRDMGLSKVVLRANTIRVVYVYVVYGAYKEFG